MSTTYSGGTAELDQSRGPAASLFPAKWPTNNKDLGGLWQARIQNGLRDRRRYEPQWHVSQAFAAGKQWLAWAPRERRLVLPPLPDGRERYTADVLTQYMSTMTGKIMSDDFRPQILFRRDDIDSQEFADQANKALGYGWDYEWDGDKVLRQLIVKVLTFGTCAIRVRFDPSIGPVVAQNVPHQNGQPILDPGEALAAVANAAATGQTLTFKDIKGRIVWEPLSAFNLIVPPGLEHDDAFPYEIVAFPRTIDSLTREYGKAKTAGVQEEVLSAIDLIGTREQPIADSDLAFSSAGGKLEGHTMVYTCYQRPMADMPLGQVTVLAGKGHVLDVQNQLPYRTPDGEPRSGICYFHYTRVPSRFWSKSLIEPGIAPQRMLNKRRSQQQEIIDRGLPYVIVEEGTLKQPPQGGPMKIVAIKPGSPKPQQMQGIGPGPWMQQDVESIYADLEKALGMREISLGAHPQGVSAYAALALMGENDQTKLDPIIQDFKLSIRHVVECTLYDIKRYWPPDKQIALAGDDGLLQAVTFNASKLPNFFQVEIAKGGSKPRSQGAKIQMIYDLYQQGGAMGQPLPLTWLFSSLQAGEPLPLPTEPVDIHEKKAHTENEEMMEGTAIGVAYYDPPEIHIPVHREQQVEAELVGRMDLAAIFENHIRQHMQVAAMNAQEQALQALPNTGPPPMVGQQGAPPGNAGPEPLNVKLVRSLQEAGKITPSAGVKIP